MAQDLKLAQYAHLAPRVTFAMQFMGAAVGAIFNYIMMNSIVTHKREILLSVEGTNIWSGQQVQQFNSLVRAPNFTTYWAQSADSYCSRLCSVVLLTNSSPSAADINGPVWPSCLVSSRRYRSTSRTACGPRWVSTMSTLPCCCTMPVTSSLVSTRLSCRYVSSESSPSPLQSHF